MKLFETLLRGKLMRLVAGMVLTTAAIPLFGQRGFNEEFQKGDLKKALETLQSNERQASSKARFIYFANNGLVLSILGKYEESNDFFEKAFLFGEDYHINYVNEAASYLSNPTVTVYRGEDHEHLMVLYFKAINYLKMNDPEKALVECRRLNIRLNQLSDKYSSDTKFRRDAFIHTLMGIIYQSARDYNNAFIAYRNAVEIYETDYANLFSLNVPEQLKRDLLNTAWWTGFTDEFEFFRTKFGMPAYEAPPPGASLVFFWHNGLAPVKSEWSINFIIDRRGDQLVFVNEAMGLVFPFRVEEDKDKKGVENLEIFRVAFPKYVDRYAYYESATLESGQEYYQLEEAEDISKIAFHSLQQRMMLEFGKGLLRAASKKAAEHSIRKEDERLGALIGLVNAITEKADTRNWQTLPRNIYYARVPLAAGENNVALRLRAGSDEVVYDFTYRADEGATLFHTFSSLESSVAPRASFRDRWSID